MSQHAWTGREPHTSGTRLTPGPDRRLARGAGATTTPGRLIRAERFARGWTQEQAAEIAGVSVGAWRTTESGRRRPRPQTFAAILQALDLAPEDVRAAGPPETGERVEQQRDELLRLCADELAPEQIEPVLRVVRLLTDHHETE